MAESNGNHRSMKPNQSQTRDSFGSRRQKPNRPRGTGALIVRTERSGRQTYYGKWYAADGQQVRRKLGPKRPRGSREGLTEAQASRLLQRMISDTKPLPRQGERRTFAEVAEAHLKRLENQGLKRSTLRGYESLMRAHLLPYFGARSVERIGEPDIAGLDRELRNKGMKPQSRRNVLGLLGAAIRTAIKHGWATSNPVSGYEKPRKPRSEPDELRFLTLEELEAVLRAMPDDELGRVERALVVTAAMTGMRRGELLGLRWKDVDWTAHKVRVVRTFVGGRADTPKSEQSKRDVPMADRVAAELQRLWEVTPFQADEDPVFAHPRGTGVPLDGTAASKRFQAALKRAGVRHLRFHDLRHTFGTMMARDPRVSMRTLQGWLGHADPATTAIYAHFAPNALHAEWIQDAFTSTDPADPSGLRIGSSSGGAFVVTWL
jgi:integrase